MRVKASSVFCHSCNEWLPRSKFNLLCWHKSQTCKKCEAKEKVAYAAELDRTHKEEYKENIKSKKQAERKATASAEIHHYACDAFEERNIQKQVDDELGIYE